MSTSRTPMGDLVIAAVIIGASIIIAVAINIYFSPFHTCVRAVDTTTKQKPESYARPKWGGETYSR